MAQRIQLRRGTAAQWTSANPILALGEPGFETDTCKIKFGDGVSAWGALDYFDAGSGGAGVWGSITGTLADQSDLQTALNLKANTSALSGYATTSALTSGLAGKENTITAGTTAQYYRGDKSWQTLNKAAVGLGNVDNTSDANKPISTAVQTALDGKQAAGSYAAASHTHAIADVTGLQTALDGKQASGSYVITSDFTWTNLSGKPTTFAPSAHSHAIADVTGLQTALDGKQAAGSYAAATHTHVISDVTGLQAALDGKQAAGSYLTGNQTITLSGDLSGSGATAISASLATVNSDVGTFGSGSLVPVITVDAKGRITGVSTTAVSASGGGITTNAVTFNSSGSGAASGTTFDGSAARTISYNTLGAAASSHTHGIADITSIPTGTVFYRKTAGSGAAETQTLATLKTDLGLTGTNSGDQTITLTGDVTGSGTGSFAATIGSGAVSLAKMANLAANSIIGNNTGSSATPLALTGAQVTAMLSAAVAGGAQGVMTGADKTKLDGIATGATANTGTVTTVSVTTANGVSGSVATASTTPAITLTLGAITPSSVAASGTVTGSNLSGTNTGDQFTSIATASLLGRSTAGTGAAEVLTAAQGRTLLGVTQTGSDTTYAYRSNNLSDLASASTARTNLGLGTAATRNIHVGTTAPGSPATGDLWVDTN